LLAGFDEETQKKQPKANLSDFEDRYGSNPTVLSIIWSDLQKTTNPEAFVPEHKRKLNYYLMAHHFLKQYPTESERKAAYNKDVKRTHTQRDWVWYFVDRICALQQEKIYIPESHLNGDDIWIMSVDGTMNVSNEIAGEENPKDPSMFSFKHHSAGFNTEVGVSLLESRCVWINGPEPAGANTDLVLFKKPGGLAEFLLQHGKKCIGDGGYAGQPLVCSTPNGHDSPSVRKFKARALKRHEKFNNMLKSFKCLSAKFRHTGTGSWEKERWKSCFGAVAVICQYQLENGKPLYNIYVGDM
jgi:hypothetical protein